MKICACFLVMAIALAGCEGSDVAGVDQAVSICLGHYRYVKLE